jgi:hypothetical protein
MEMMDDGDVLMSEFDFHSCFFDSRDGKVVATLKDLDGGWR